MGDLSSTGRPKGERDEKDERGQKDLSLSRTSSFQSFSPRARRPTPALPFPSLPAHSAAIMRTSSRSAGILVVLLMSLSFLTGVPSLRAAEKKSKKPPASRTPGDLTSPDGRYRVTLTLASGQQSAAITDAKTGVELLQLSSAGSPWISEGSHVLWSPDSQRLAFVTPSRRGDSTDLSILHDGKWELVDFPELPGFKWRGHKDDSKTVLAAVTALRWLKPNVLQLQNKVEDDEGKSASVVFAITFDPENHLTVKKMK